MKITIEVDETFDSMPVLLMLADIDKLCLDHMVDGLAGDQTCKVMENIRKICIKREEYK